MSEDKRGWGGVISPLKETDIITARALLVFLHLLTYILAFFYSHFLTPHSAPWLLIADTYSFYMQIIPTAKMFHQFKKKEEWRKERGWRCSLLTGIRRVSSRAVEEVGWSSQCGHACVTVSIHTGGDGTVAALLGRGAGHITVRRNTARVSTETWNKNTDLDERTNTEFNTKIVQTYCNVCMTRTPVIECHSDLKLI